ncbi:MAG TPA: hypothetical protein VIH75_03880 [Candidatus Sulfotelmatobacter sp.]
MASRHFPGLASAAFLRSAATRWLPLCLPADPKGVQVALLFLFFHNCLCGPLANSRFHHTPDPAHAPDSKLEATDYKADKAIQNIVDLLAAA